MSEEFDPYRKWLGIAPHEQPPHHYRLLGIAPFEDDADVIQNAADRQMAHVRTYQSGRYRDYSQRLLNELSQANITLLDPAKKAVYDAQLHDALFSTAEPEVEGPPPEMPPVAMPAPREVRAVPMGQAIPVSTSVPVAKVASVATVPVVSVGGKSRSAAARNRARKKNSVVPIIFGLIGVGALLVGMLVFIVSQTDGTDTDNTNNKNVAKTDKEKKEKPDKTEPTPTPPNNKKSKSDKRKEASESVANLKIPPAVNPADLPREQKFKMAIVEARDALARRDLAKANAALVEADYTKDGAKDEEEVKHLRALYALLDEFWRAVRAGVYERMQPGDVVEFRGDTVELISREGEMVTLKYNDEDHTIKVADLPGPMAVLLARKALNLKEPRALLALAAFWTLDTQASRRGKAQERAKELWVEAAEQGVKDPAIARELALDAGFISSIETKPKDKGPLVERPMTPKPEDEPSTDTPPASSQAKQPPPAADQLRDAKQRFAAKYGEDLARARKTPTEHETFMTRLETEAPQEKDNALAYVMYQEACDAAATVLRHDTLMKLVDEMDQKWTIDALRAKQLLLLQTRPINSPATDNFADTAAELAKTAHEAGRLDVAIAAANYSLRVGDKVKGRDQKELLRRVREWETFADAQAKAKAGEESLTKDNADGSAHLQVGRFQCYFENKWPEGLTHLKQSDSDDEKTAATEDLANPTEPLAQYAVAERWYMLAKRKSGTARLAVLQRAKLWYERSLAALDADTRATAESRLREIDKDLAPLAGT